MIICAAPSPRARIFRAHFSRKVEFCAVCIKPEAPKAAIGAAAAKANFVPQLGRCPYRVCYSLHQRLLFLLRCGIECSSQVQTEMPQVQTARLRSDRTGAGFSDALRDVRVTRGVGWRRRSAQAGNRGVGLGGLFVVMGIWAVGLPVIRSDRSVELAPLG